MSARLSGAPCFNLSFDLGACGPLAVKAKPPSFLWGRTPGVSPAFLRWRSVQAG